ncbi:hypothetical protein LX36DRAFT_712176 [Colletotrichum falcatum]|nr:hypothetical protein LX36DRAFT_712176 [Colletotrichum falcatum]
MRSALVFLAALLLAAGADACATYHKCHCTNADNTANDTMTAVACNNSNMLAPDSPGWPVYTKEQDSVLKCIINLPSITDVVTIDNCKFREFCTAAGATGPDSWCENH